MATEIFVFEKMFWTIPWSLNSFSHVLENMEVYKAFHMKYLRKSYMFPIKSSLKKKS